MQIDPDKTQAAFELGSAVFQILNVRAIRSSKTLAGVHWLPTAFFGAWGVYNLWFYTVIHLPLAWWAGLAITCVNVVWLAHVGYYGMQRRYFGKAWERYLAQLAQQDRIISLDGRDQ